MLPKNPDLFSVEGRRECLHDSYLLVAGEIACLAALAGGVEPDDDVCDALAHLACAMKSLAAARDKALKEWAADGGDACYTEAELDKLLGELGKIAREEQATAAAIPDFATVMAEKHDSGCQCFACVTAAPASDLTARVYGRMGYDRVDPLANGSADGAVDALEEKP